jgi:hypothetical protein
MVERPNLLWRFMAWFAGERIIVLDDVPEPVGPPPQFRRPAGVPASSAEDLAR